MTVHLRKGGLMVCKRRNFKTVLALMQEEMEAN